METETSREIVRPQAVVWDVVYDGAKHPFMVIQAEAINERQSILLIEQFGWSGVGKWITAEQIDGAPWEEMFQVKFHDWKAAAEQRFRHLCESTIEISDEEAR